MKTSFRLMGLSFALTGFGVATAIAQTSAVSGRWDASLIRPNGDTIPFRLDIKGSGTDTKGIFYNGFEPFDSTTSGSFKDGNLNLHIDHYLSTLQATLKNGELVGEITTQNRASTGSYGFRAVRHVDAPVPANVPQIGGDYILPLTTPSAKGEKAFHFIVEQRGAEVAATILRVDGDTGAYTGTFKDSKWRLSHFDGSRPGGTTLIIRFCRKRRLKALTVLA